MSRDSRRRRTRTGKPASIRSDRILYEGRDSHPARPRYERSGRSRAPRVAIINETMAKFYFPGVNPIGKHITAFDRMEIVGVARDVQDHDFRDEPARRFYVSYFQPIDGITTANFEIRSDGNAGALSTALRRRSGGREPESAGPQHQGGPRVDGRERRTGAAGGEAVRLLRRAGDGAGHHRPVWGDVVRGGAPDQRDRHPHRAGRRRRECDPYDTGGGGSVRRWAAPPESQRRM